MFHILKKSPENNGAKWNNTVTKDFFFQLEPPLSEFNIDECRKVYNFVSKKIFIHVMSAGVVETGCFIESTAVKGYNTTMEISDGRDDFRVTSCDDIWKP